MNDAFNAKLGMCATYAAGGTHCVVSNESITFKAKAGDVVKPIPKDVDRMDSVLGLAKEFYKDNLCLK